MRENNPHPVTPETILVTGAAGFIGRYVVAEALNRGYRVKAVMRSPTPIATLPWIQHPQLTPESFDLRDGEALSAALVGVDAVIHLAATLAGTEAQHHGTVAATRSLLTALAATTGIRLIAVSSLAVYDHSSLPAGAKLTETTPIEPHPELRDPYTQAKLRQEQLIQTFRQTYPEPVTLLRPGIVYGRDRLWTASLGINLKNRLWVCIGQQSRLPLLYVENCATAILQSLETKRAPTQPINLIDDDLPTQQAYRMALQQAGVPLPWQITLPWTGVDRTTQAFWAIAGARLCSRFTLPGLLIPARNQARFKPLSYDNREAKQALNWQPDYSLTAALHRVCSPLSLPQVTPVTPSSNLAP